MNARPGRALFWAALAATLIALAPMLLASAAGAIAHALGCRLDEGDAHACLLAGTDIGGLLYSWFVMGWFFLLTMWLVPAAIILWIAAIVARFKFRAGGEA